MNSSSLSNKVYLPSLNGIRFIAACLVIVSHIELFKFRIGLPSVRNKIPFIDSIGSLGVTLFFVLSGFLITYLLLVEKEKTLTIRIKEFYIRRALRIWPLYYFIIFLAFFLLPLLLIKDPFHQSSHSLLCLILFLILAPNIGAILTHPSFASHLWSIGVEEQFYLIWPWIIKKIKPQKMLLTFILIIVTINIIHITSDWISENYIFGNSKASVIFQTLLPKFLNGFRIDSMAIGAVGALLALKIPQEKYKIIFDSFFQILVTGTLILFIVFAIYIPYINNIIYSSLFLLVIMNLSLNTKSLINLENNYLNYLGQISYGLYMYHPICIILALNLGQYAFNPEPQGILFNLFIYVTSFSIAIVISSLSYEYIEKIFLQFKNKFTVVKSGLR